MVTSSTREGMERGLQAQLSGVLHGWMYSKTQELISGENSLSPNASGDGGRIP